MRKILVTTALPYANGPLHLGHILENIQADIWVRWQRLVGNDCIFISGDDAHGTPIMLSAAEQGIAPDVFVAKFKEEHEKDFSDFYVSFDNYYTTHSSENRQLTSSIYKNLKANGDIVIKDVEQAYDPVIEIFLPDRFIKGTCPRCKSPDQYGDSCEVCGATYDALELIDAVSRLSGSKPILKISQHYFFDLGKYLVFLQAWTKENGHLQMEIQNKLDEWFAYGLKSWDISRDAPYFGFEIPDAPQKYFYVWLDAPIGYMASLENLSKKRAGINFSDYWSSDSVIELYHFIGKDIVYFHALFWPAVLKSCGFRTPTAIFSHGFVTVNGQKMSKSRGTFITARRYLENFDPEYLRYYFAAKLTPGIDDLDLNFADFAQRVNSDLVGKIVNIASRCASFINKNFQGRLAAKLDSEELFSEFVAKEESIGKYYEQRRYSEAVREIMALADQANRYIDVQKPWVLIKETNQKEQVQLVATMGLNLFRLLMVYLKPILPKMSKNVEKFLQITPLSWQDCNRPLLTHTIGEFHPLMQRVSLDIK